MLVRKGGGASGPDTNTGNLVATGTAQITGDSGFGTAPVSTAKITLNQGNVTNKPALALTNLGLGSSGIKMEPAGGGSFQLGPVSGNDFQISAVNRTVSMQVNNSAFDGAAAQSFLMQHASRAAATLLVLKALDVGQSGDILQLQKSTGGVLAKVSATGQLTLTSDAVTTSKPMISGTQTWNNAGTTFAALFMNITNTASAAGSMLADYQVGGTSYFRLALPGGGISRLVLPENSELSFSNNTGTSPGTRIVGSGGSGLHYYFNGVRMACLATGAGFTIASAEGLGWTNTTDGYSSNKDTMLYRGAAGRVDVCGSSSAVAADLKLKNLLVSGSAGTYVQTPSMTVGTLAAAATAGAGARAFVTDANSTTFLSIVAGGGANKVPVVSDGTNWLIG